MLSIIPLGQFLANTAIQETTSDHDEGHLFKDIAVIAISSILYIGTYYALQKCKSNHRKYKVTYFDSTNKAYPPYKIPLLLLKNPYYVGYGFKLNDFERNVVKELKKNIKTRLSKNLTSGRLMYSPYEIKGNLYLSADFINKKYINVNAYVADVYYGIRWELADSKK